MSDDDQYEHDKKNAVTIDGVVSKPYRHQLQTPLPGQVFPGWWDALLSLNFLPSLADWLGGRPYGCHAACYDFAVPKFLDVTQSLLFFRVTERNDLPISRWYGARRFAWMREQLAVCVQRRYPVLPLELCLMISGDLVPEYAIAGLVGLWPHVDAQQAERERQGNVGVAPGKRANRGRARIDRTADVWARYVHIDGVRYVASLSNENNDDSSSAAPQQRVHVAKVHEAGESAAGISLLEDHLGITELQFFRDRPALALPSDWPPVVYMGTRWSNLRFGDGSFISTVSDGVKLREITNPLPDSEAGGGANCDDNDMEE
ncbi:hypothetical protein PG993_000182 [Apiospora rasikravindrae]|uniref:Uncharacterized protein n=1 Tax=Apiospora rasikravindrae TaxID=990691 RepID=A0ABR1U7V7_9PEZI